MRDESEKKNTISEKTYFSFGVVVIIVTIAIWIIRAESHAANDAIEIQFVKTKLQDHETRQNILEREILERLINIDQRTARIEGKLSK